MLRTDQKLAVLRNQFLIIDRQPSKILIQEKVAIMLAIRKVIDDHQSTTRRSQKTFPAGIQSVVIHDDPIRLERLQKSTTELGVLFLR